jgi:hypothetical protein
MDRPGRLEPLTRILSLKSTHTDSKITSTLCPYCNRPLRWIAMRWLARGVFECDRCGEFSDFRRPLSAAADFAPFES